MARGRFLSTTIAKDKRLNDLPLESALVYMMTIPHLDRDGLIEGEPSVLWGTVCPRRLELLAGMADIIASWIDAGLVDRFECDDEPVLHFRGFVKNQSGMRYDREAPSRFRLPQTNSGQTPELLRTYSGYSPAQVEVEDQDQVEVKVEVEDSATASPAWKCWLENMPGTPTPHIIAAVNELIDQYGDDKVVRAILIAVERDKRSLGYVRGILQRGLDSEKPNGYTSKADRNRQVFDDFRKDYLNGHDNGTPDHVHVVPERGSKPRATRQLPAASGQSATRRTASGL